MQKTITEFLKNSISTKQQMLDDSSLLAQIEESASEIKKRVANGGTVYICGNGGSACDAMHFAEELVARYKRERPGIKAMHLLDSGVLSCWSNDYSYDTVFERQVETFCNDNDILVAISTSGNSSNVLKAVEAAKKKSSYTIGLTGRGGGELASLCDQGLIIPSDETDRIQEAHITLIHIFCELLEN